MDLSRFFPLTFQCFFPDINFSKILSDVASSKNLPEVDSSEEHSSSVIDFSNYIISVDLLITYSSIHFKYDEDDNNSSNTIDFSLHSRIWITSSRFNMISSFLDFFWNSTLKLLPFELSIRSYLQHQLLSHIYLFETSFLKQLPRIPMFKNHLWSSSSLSLGDPSYWICMFILSY